MAKPSKLVALALAESRGRATFEACEQIEQHTNRLERHVARSGGSHTSCRARPPAK